MVFGGLDSWTVRDFPREFPVNEMMREAQNICFYLEKEQYLTFTFAVWRKYVWILQNNCFWIELIRKSTQAWTNIWQFRMVVGQRLKARQFRSNYFRSIAGNRHVALDDRKIAWPQRPFADETAEFSSALQSSYTGGLKWRAVHGAIHGLAVGARKFVNEFCKLIHQMSQKTYWSKFTLLKF